MATSPAVLVVLAMTSAVAVGGCKKKSGSPGPDPGNWLVGDDGLMVAVTADGRLGEPYELGADVDLLGIACRGAHDAFVVGEAGTLLRTFDGGASWEAIELGTVATLRSVAADATGTVVVAADGQLWVSHDSGARFAAVADGRFISVAASDRGDALALDDGGGLWRVDASGASAITRVPGARAVAISHDGGTAAVVGTGGVVARSLDGGASWALVVTPGTADLGAAWVAMDGTVLAVGAAGATVRVAPDGTIARDGAGDRALHALHVDASGVGYAGGDGGALWVTDDGGATWRELELELGRTVRGLDQLDGAGHW